MCGKFQFCPKGKPGLTEKGNERDTAPRQVIHIRITKKEHEDIISVGASCGYPSYASFVRSLIRRSLYGPGVEK